MTKRQRPASGSWKSPRGPEHSSTRPAREFAFKTAGGRSGIYTATTPPTSDFRRTCARACSTSAGSTITATLDKPGFGTRRIETDADINDVIALMRLNNGASSHRQQRPWEQRPSSRR